MRRSSAQRPSRRSSRRPSAREPWFAARVLAVVTSIPRGHVATYGQIASLCGSPRAARQVGWILRNERAEWSVQRVSESKRAPPWWRVVNRKGRLSIIHPHLTPATQAALLRKEGVRVRRQENAYWVDLRHFLWNPQGARV